MFTVYVSFCMCSLMYHTHSLTEPPGRMQFLNYYVHNIYIWYKQINIYNYNSKTHGKAIIGMVIVIIMQSIIIGNLCDYSPLFLAVLHWLLAESLIIACG